MWKVGNKVLVPAFPTMGLLTLHPHLAMLVAASMEAMTLWSWQITYRTSFSG